MKFRAFLLSVILAAGVSLPTLANAQTDPKQTPPTDQTQPASKTQPADQTQPAAQSVPTDQSQEQVKHTGGKDDVDAIGNRKIGGVDWYSIEKEVRMGKEYAMQIEQSMKMVQDPVVTEYINRIGQNLVRNSDAKVPFTIKVVDSDEVNNPGEHRQPHDYSFDLRGWRHWICRPPGCGHRVAAHVPELQPRL